MASVEKNFVVKNGLDVALDATVSGDLTINGGDIILGGTGRIQGIDTVTDPTDATSKEYVDAAVAGSGGFNQEEIEDIVGAMVSTNTENGISVTYDDVNGKLDFDVNDFTITLGGDLTGNVTITDLTSATLTATIAPNSVELGTDTTGNYVATGATAGNGISGSATGEGSTFTVTSNATNSNTPSTIVFRDASGNFSAGTITASLNGTATSANNATTVTTVSDNASNSTRYLTFVDQADLGGSNQSIKHDSGLSYNPSTGRITATAFSGNGANLSSLNASNLATGTVPSARLSGTYNITATNATIAANVTTAADDTTNATRYLTFVDSATGSSQVIRHDNGLTYNPLTGDVSALNFNTTSDGNLKKNIETASGMDVVSQLRGVEFNWKGGSEAKSSGVIAQEIEQVLPHVVSENINGKSVNYPAIIAYLIEGMKDLQTQIEELKKQVK